MDCPFLSSTFFFAVYRRAHEGFFGCRDVPLSIALALVHSLPFGHSRALAFRTTVLSVTGVVPGIAGHTWVFGSLEVLLPPFLTSSAESDAFHCPFRNLGHLWTGNDLLDVLIQSLDAILSMSPSSPSISNTPIVDVSRISRMVG